MGIMTFQRSRFLRITAAITLTTFLAGCLPGAVKTQNPDDSSLSGMAGSAMGAFSSLTNMASSLADQIGVDLPGSKKGSDHRSWSATDQQGAERAKAAFAGSVTGMQQDNLPVYDPLKSGEAARYTKMIKALSVKYGNRKDLSPEEMLEVSTAVVPVMRYLYNSRMYRQNNKTPAKPIAMGKTQQSVVIAPGATVEMVVLNFCNDHGLPAPWSSAKLQFRSATDYMPSELLPIFKGMHSYVAQNPGQHWAMQSTVWWLRDTPCKNESLSKEGWELIDHSTNGARQVLASYCMKQQAKDAAMDMAKRYIPVPAGGQSMLAQYQTVMAQANDIQSRADVFLNADLTNPADILKLADASGFANKTGMNNMLNNPYLRTAMSAANNKALIRAITPSSIDDQATAATLNAMVQLGDSLGERANKDTAGISDYSDLGNGLVAQVLSTHSASSSVVRIKNTGTVPVTFDGSDYVLSTVNDPAAKEAYRPTQRLSIGGLIPSKMIQGGTRDDGKRYTLDNEKVAKNALLGLKNNGFALEMPTGDGETVPKEDCFNRKIDFGTLGLAVMQDTIESVPVLGNVLFGFQVVTGRSWFDGHELSGEEIGVSVMGIAMGNLSNKVKLGAAIFGGLMAVDSGVKNTAGIAQTDFGDACTYVNAGLNVATTYYCARPGVSATKCAHVKAGLRGAEAGGGGQAKSDSDFSKSTLGSAIKNISSFEW